MSKILLVEDDKSLREIYGVRLLAEGYDIVSAGDGEEALAMAIKERPHLIVSDVMMPKISGFDMLDILRSTTETKDIKVIMMTALSSEDQRLRGEQLGADRYLVKSQVGIEDVVRTVHEVLGDAPMTLGAQNSFGSSAPSAVPRPAPAVAPRPEPVATTAPQYAPAPAVPEPQPVAAAPAPAVAAPQPQPVAPAPTYSAPSDTPSSSLPQPTAPFSTARPAGLADRIIQPLERPEDSSEPIGSLMDKELGTPPAQAPQFAPPVAPPPPPAPQLPVQQPASQPVPVSYAQPEPTAEPLNQPDTDGISFEETPRPTQ